MRDKSRTVLVVNTLAFAVSFAAWVMLGPTGAAVARASGFGPGSVALVKSLPILAGALLRVPIGVLANRLGARLVFPAAQILGAIGAVGVSFAASPAAFVVSGLLLGLVGTTFVVGVESVSSWTPPARQGFALGVFGMGNAGTAVSTLAMPLLVASLGYRASVRLFAIALVVSAVSYAAIVRDPERRGPSLTLRQVLAPLADVAVLRFSLYYMATFGAFVATTLVVSDLYVEVHHVSPRVAGLLATTFTFSASVIRSLGGRLSDRHGPDRVMIASLVVIAGALFGVALGPSLALTVTLVFVAGLAMGIGSAATFKYVPMRYPRAVGAVSGVVGALGGLGGFVLPPLGAAFAARFGAPSAAAAALGVLAVVSLPLVVFVERKRERPPEGSLRPRPL